MKLSTKIFFLSSAIAAAILISRSGSAAAVDTTLPDTTYVPPPGGDPTPAPDPASYPSYTYLVDLLYAHYADWASILKPTSANGITQVSSSQMINDAAGRLDKSKLPPALAPIQKVSSVYLHHHEASHGMTLSWNDQYMFCVFPSNIFRTADGYYIAAQESTGKAYITAGGSIVTSAKNVTDIVPPGFSFYDSNLNYVGKISLISNYWTVDLHPPGSSEYKTADLGYQCSI